MADDVSNEEEGQDSQPVAGERLAAARRDQEIALRDVAKELHLDETKVQALEQNRFDTLGPPVFARGHLRKYAEIVGVDAGEILAEYAELTTGVGEPPIVGKPRRAAREIDLTGYMVPGAIVLVIVIAIVLWMQAGSPLPSFDRSDPASDAAIELALPETVPTGEPLAEALPEPESAASTEEAPAPPETASMEEPVDEEPASSPEPAEPPPEPAAAPLPSGPQVSLELVFTGNCWTEVTDADGQRLFFDLGSEGRSVVVNGSAPLRVLFGSYANVALVVNGDDYPIPASARRGETARFTINAP